MNKGTSPHIPQTDLQAKTILIIDDNPSNLKVLAEYLEAYGFEISVARNGRTVWRKPALSCHLSFLWMFLCRGLMASRPAVA
jgi:DNA-binding NtrC family response regulator